ncbi:MAG: MBOAT family protein [Atopobiaceae bacterium]|nr:MBOAT family protein [Atopobiaceae bacterium]
MTSYFTITFALIFLPASVVLYALAPKRLRWCVLLGLSLLFMWHLSKRLTALFAASALSVYACGLGMEAAVTQRGRAIAEGMAKKDARSICKKRMRAILAAGIIVNVGLLVASKYLEFFSQAVLAIVAPSDDGASGLTSLGAPIGISFYTMMALSYLADVYRETIPAEHHLGRLALFLCFFPQVMEGPICRYGQTASALYAGEPLKRRNLYEGALRILYGMAKKIVVADRLNILVETVFDGKADYDGGIVAFAAILYTVQLYCDFSGAMDVALGMGHIFNVELPENFKQPFFSKTASEFWQRWHITLGTWFKDYVYYPVSLSKGCKKVTAAARKALGNRYGPLLAGGIALFCVWFLNGLWHGAGSQYLFFGMYYFAMIFAGGFIEPVAQSLSERYRIDRSSLPYRIFRTVRTLIIVFVGELFFRAPGLGRGIELFSTIVKSFSLASFADGTFLTLGLDAYDLVLVLIVFAGVIAVDVARERGVSLCTELGSRRIPLRWAALVALFLVIVIFGAYGYGYEPVDPLYAQF